jgi:uncharacterized UBP type Zn finger protein
LKRELAKTLPKYLIVVMNRFIAVDWVPKKLNALIQMPDVFDFKDVVF